MKIIFIISINLFLNSKCISQNYNNRVYRPDSIPRVGLYAIKNKVNNKLSDSLFYEILAREIGFSNLQSNSIGLRLRVWLLDFEKQYVLDVTIDSLEKKYTIVKLSGSLVDSIYYLKIENVITGLVPKFGWNNFITKMHLNKIFQLKSGKVQESSRHSHLTHGVFYGFELVRDGKYNNFKYFEPSFYRLVDNDSNNVFKFLNYLNKIFPVKIYNRGLKLYTNK
jgi:hypothetical protein